MPSFRRRVVHGIFAALAALFATGCGSGTATVSGTVTYQGQPLSGGSVIIYCADKQIVRGMIGPDGGYTIPNVPRGSVVVTVQSNARIPVGLRSPQHLPPFTSGTPTPPPVGLSAGTPSETRGAVLPPRFALPEESGLSVVVDRAHVMYDIHLKP
jgi:hypothetical protein